MWIKEGSLQNSGQLKFGGNLNLGETHYGQKIKFSDNKSENILKNVFLRFSI